ncbi:MAG: FkbM family methyltransferase [Wenzhouxiangella sp.]
MKYIKSRISRALLWDVSDGFKFSRNFNAYCKLRGRRVRVLSFSKADGYLIRQPDGEEVFVGRPSRIKENYLAKENRGDSKELYKKYLLEGVRFRPGDVCIDVGANIGELSLYLGRRFRVSPIACEPDPVEIGSLKANMARVGGIVVPQPLWESAGDMTFYLANDTGDSSLIKGRATSKPITTRCTTLDDVVRQHIAHGSESRIRLLKLEAEGAEPEILRGGASIIEKVDYISADLGPERGLAKENTVADCSNFLYSRGFRI